MMRDLQRAGALLSVLAGLVIFGAAPAAADRNFTVRFTDNTQGDVTGTGNSLVTCRVLDLGCTDAREGRGNKLNNNDRFMTLVDVDGDPSTFNSSSATLRLPAGAQVQFAGLYFGGRSEAGSGGDPAPDPAARDRVLLRTPGSTTYQRLTAPGGVDVALDTSGLPREYQGFVDVTSLVAAGGAGVYTVADVQLGTGLNADQSGGWALGVAYKDAALSTRNLTIFDGLKFVTANGPAVDIPLTGFQTPKSGTVNSRVGLIAYEGDLGTFNDFAELDGQRLTNATNPSDNFFNSSISAVGVPFVDRTPSYANGFGFDADFINAAGILHNDQTSTTLHLSTNGDGYAPGAVSFATDMYAPSLALTKSVDKADAQAGDVLTYEISARNNGVDAAVNTSLFDPLPAGTTFVPGSLSITSGANAGGKSDAPGDDQAEYDPAARAVVFRLGTNATAAQGGRLAVDESTSIRFQVTVDEGLPKGTVLTNRGTATYTGDTLGITSDASTPPVDTKVHVPDLTIAKSHGSGALRAGADVTFSLVVSNIGDAPSRGRVTVTDTLNAHMSFAGPVAGPGWTCTTTGRSFTCTRDDALAPNAKFPTISVPAHIAADTPAGDLRNTAEVSGGGDGDTSNNTDTDSVTAYVDLAVDKSADAPVVFAGSAVGFTIRVTNLGRARATEVRLADVVPDGLILLKLTTSQGTCRGATCSLGTLNSGAAVTLHLLAVAAQGTGGKSLTNRVAVRAAEDEPVLSNNRDSASVQVLELADLRVTKTAAAPTVPAGSDVAFVITVKNAGPSDATDVVLDDELPAGLTLKSATPSQGTCTGLSCALGALPVNGTAQVLVVATSSASLAGQTLTNAASVDATQPDPNHSNNRDTATVTFTADPPPPPANVTVTKTASTDSVTVGELLTYTITATNAGPGAAANVVVTDTPGAAVLVDAVTPSQGTCTTDTPIVCNLGPLAPGASATVTVQVRPLVAGPLSNGASALDPSGGAVGGTGTTVDPAVPDVRITKRALQHRVDSGRTVTYVIGVRSGGTGTARDLLVCDRLPSTMSYASLGGATLRNGRACWRIAALAPGTRRTFRLTARAATDASSTRAPNVAMVAGAGVRVRVATAVVRILPRPARGGGVTG
jgi:uncharacterized repeat protein (TIGR01451 family)